ncbi:hypothetical protein E2C01_033593 [Portunus trituberculatus]|uniref:Uncharacterized protein n=1 Tax=Portunus trituberculatus TaxID=210409 RepID=A0A5B7F4I0_PORTR|nr:hypothetical protein [Portunus trituberculatus]
MSKICYFGVFQRFMQQNSEMQAKHTICVRNLNMSEMGYFGVFQRFMHQHSEMQAKHNNCVTN